MIGKGHLLDIWKPNREINNSGEVFNADYELEFKNAEGRFHEMSSERKVLAQVFDISKKHKTFISTELINLEMYYILYHKTFNEFYLINVPVLHTNVPKNYWRADCILLDTPPKKILLHYD